MSEAPEHEFLAFMAAIRHDQIDYIVDVLQEYTSVTEWLVSLEKTDKAHKETEGEHLHFLIRMSDNHYKNFADRIFRKKYNLRGQSKKGVPRQYGKLREIHDLERMGSYTCKEQNLRHNIDGETIKRWVERSFKKKDEYELRDNIYTHLDNATPPETIDKGMCQNFVLNTWNEKPPLFLRIEILKYFRENCEKTPNPNTIKNYITGYMLYHAKLSYSIEEVDAWLFGRQ